MILLNMDYALACRKVGMRAGRQGFEGTLIFYDGYDLLGFE